MHHYRISAELAQTIVDSAKEVIGYDINLIDSDGVIIASTASERIGTFHQAGRYASGQEHPVEVRDTEPWQGSRQGINYPIVVDGYRFGAIGISGDPEVCRSSGFLLTKITEVLIREQLQTHARQSLDEIRSAAARLLLFGEAPGLEFSSLQPALEQLEVSLHEPLFVILLECTGWSGSSGAFDPPLPELLRSSESRLYAYLFPNRYAVIAGQSRYPAVVRLLEDLGREGSAVRAGIGDCRSWREAQLSYRHAHTALSYAAARGLTCQAYGSMRLDMLLHQLPDSVKRDFTELRLGALTEEDRTMLRSYYRHNLSLKETAKALFLHKNTLQYRLDKITAKTGLDPREYRQSIELYVGLLLDKTSPDQEPGAG
ncbi:carbohydrate diacid regulator [Paenibacillus sp. UNCCL117]|uniref:CdaR family transcriptional regulator n=1 Tax=unclassified Paenibacillus TaxID=185978 RepID=UPI00089277F7|nr:MULTISPECIES: sugar diacid recognition domain-containing protein [unclassified Paenibacillus]SDD89973.1 carbohydrate diacid regulator [Paenibacillus sp. cl123]SFW44029.1 carbohydrate diacid regulator [Paenibacillus sp. UNCCL117]